MTLLQLLFSFLQIGLLSIGGGYAALPIIQDQVVAMHGWLSMREFADILTISQMTPGPIAINAASFVGTKIAGLPGALVASLGVVLPSFIIVLTLSFLYYKYRQLDAIQAVLKGLRPAVVALIASAGCLWESMPSGEEKRYRLQMLIWKVCCCLHWASFC
ncbi:MAG: chromate transporter [Clostridium sp.]